MSNSMEDEMGGNRTLQAALAYKCKGLRPIPIRAGSKAARIRWETLQHRDPTDVEIHAWYRKYPDDGVAILLGEYCGTFAVDVDGERGATSFAALGPWPTTLTSLTGGGGSHHFFRHEGQQIRNRVGVVPGLDIRSTDGYCVVAPSVHPETGHEYRWADQGEGGEFGVTEAPGWLIDLLREEPTPRMARAAKELFAENGVIPKGERNDTLTRASGKLLGAGWSAHGTIARLRVLNAQRCSPQLDEGELARIVASIAYREGAKSNDPKAQPKVTKARGKANLVVLSDVEPTIVEWLWHGYFPLGKLSLVMGDPGLGKSTLSIDLAARLTSGRPFPGGAALEPRGVVLLTGEDGLSDTVRPRFEAAGGDSRLAVVIQSVSDEDGGERSLSLPGDLGFVREAILKQNAAMVVIDPLMAFLSGDVNSWHDQQIRQALTPLTRLAEEMRVAVVVITHLNKKQGTSALYRSGGSIGIVAAVRAAFLVAKHPDDDSRRVLSPVKFNLGPPPQSRVFRLDGAPNGSSRVVWEGVTDLRSDQLLDSPKEGKLDTAKAFLRDQLSEGSQAVIPIEELALRAGIAKRTLDRARADLGVTAHRRGFQGAVFLSLPPEGGNIEDLAMNDDLPLDPPIGDAHGVLGSQVETDPPEAANPPITDENQGEGHGLGMIEPWYLSDWSMERQDDTQDDDSDDEGFSHVE
jgi:hypothetical protein